MVCWSQCTFSPVSDFWSHHKVTSQSVLSASQPPQIHMLTAFSSLSPSLYWIRPEPDLYSWDGLKLGHNEWVVCVE